MQSSAFRPVATPTSPSGAPSTATQLAAAKLALPKACPAIRGHLRKTATTRPLRHHQRPLRLCCPLPQPTALGLPRRPRPAHEDDGHSDTTNGCSDLTAHSARRGCPRPGRPRPPLQARDDKGHYGITGLRHLRPPACCCRPQRRAGAHRLLWFLARGGHSLSHSPHWKPTTTTTPMKRSWPL
ncbi:hypothetical protein ZWY2020_009585 [Hordeum vulgare]|nr:hypothetical protein ZWY2020_009585 [Hordeum vulgare]